MLDHVGYLLRTDPTIIPTVSADHTRVSRTSMPAYSLETGGSMNAACPRISIVLQPNSQKISANGCANHSRTRPV